MKSLARWFFLWTHHDEYIEVTKYIKSARREGTSQSLQRVVGAIEVLYNFNMLKD